MPHTARKLLFLAAATALLNLAGCATSKQWAVSDSDKQQGLVRVSYEFPEFREPSVSDSQAEKLALNRCSGWGYDAAQPIPGQLRQCSNMDGGNCDLWKVTREYQCTRDVAFAGSLSR
jgi:hypothetical protein